MISSSVSPGWAALLDRAEPLVVDAIKRMRAAHVGFQELLMDAERFLEDRAALSRQPSAMASVGDDLTYEQQHAIKEAACIAAHEEYFDARKDFKFRVSRDAAFDAGFSRGWDAALAAAKPEGGSHE